MGSDGGFADLQVRQPVRTLGALLRVCFKAFSPVDVMVGDKVIKASSNILMPSKYVSYCYILQGKRWKVYMQRYTMSPTGFHRIDAKHNTSFYISLKDQDYYLDHQTGGLRSHVYLRFVELLWTLPSHTFPRYANVELITTSHFEYQVL